MVVSGTSSQRMLLMYFPQSVVKSRKCSNVTDRQGCLSKSISYDTDVYFTKAQVPASQRLQRRNGLYSFYN